MGGADGIHMTYTREGRATGEGYLELTSAEDVERALKKHNQHLGPRYIEGNKNFLLFKSCIVQIVSSDAFNSVWTNDNQ